jgi:hypothetical protein
MIFSIDAQNYDLLCARARVDRADKSELIANFAADLRRVMPHNCATYPKICGVRKKEA